MREIWFKITSLIWTCKSSWNNHPAKSCLTWSVLSDNISHSNTSLIILELFNVPQFRQRKFLNSPSPSPSKSWKKIRAIIEDVRKSLYYICAYMCLNFPSQVILRIKKKKTVALQRRQCTENYTNGRWRRQPTIGWRIKFKPNGYYYSGWSDMWGHDTFLRSEEEEDRIPLSVNERSHMYVKRIAQKTQPVQRVYSAFPCWQGSRLLALPPPRQCGRPRFLQIPSAPLLLRSPFPSPSLCSLSASLNSAPNPHP